MSELARDDWHAACGYCRDTCHNDSACIGGCGDYRAERRGGENALWLRRAPFVVHLTGAAAERAEEILQRRKTAPGAQPSSPGPTHTEQETM